MTADVAGRVYEILLKAGDPVTEGDNVALIEAMKMEIPVASTASGAIKAVLVNVDDMVSEGQVIAIVET